MDNLKIYGLIYKITNLINGKTYIGQTTKSIEKRWNIHLYNAKRGQKSYLYDAIRKYGENNFIPEIICKCYSKEDMNNKEKHYIIECKSFWHKNGYNLSSGGEGSSEIRQPSDANKRRSDKLKGIPKSLETRRKMRENHALKGKHHSEEARRKMRENHADFSGKNNPMFGHIYTTEEREKKSRDTKEGMRKWRMKK